LTILRKKALINSQILVIVSIAAYRYCDLLERPTMNRVGYNSRLLMIIHDLYCLGRELLVNSHELA